MAKETVEQDSGDRATKIALGVLIVIILSGVIGLIAMAMGLF